MIEITEIAANKILEIAADEGLEGQHLRVNILGSGCAGFSFDLFFDSDSPTEDDMVFETRGIKIVVNQLSSLYLDGTEIDYVDSLFGAGFKFNNPNFSSQCGCGKSFGL